LILAGGKLQANMPEDDSWFYGQHLTEFVVEYNKRNAGNSEGRIDALGRYLN